MRWWAAAPMVLALVACERRPSPGTPDAQGPVLELPPDVNVAKTSATKTSTVPQTIYRSHFTMGSQVTITAYTLDEAGALAAFDEAFREFDRLDGLLSVWKAESDIVRLNEAAGVSPVKVSPETFEALARSKEGSEWTKGKFDVTFGVLSGLWKFDHDQDNTIPPPSEVKKRIKLIDYRKLTLDPFEQTAFLQEKGMKVHLGGIGKGFAVDRTVAILRQRGLRDFMIQAGGDMFVSGHHGDRAWRVGIRDPRGPPDSYFAASEVTNATFSTSGDYERFFIAKGRRYHHIIDPATGSPATKCRSVTIMAPTATMAEILSKGVFILGPAEGVMLVDNTPDAGAVIVDAHNAVIISKRMEGKVKILAPPTDAP